MEARTEDKFLQVLPLVVGGIQDVQMLCGLLQVSSTVRSALQQARASGVADSRSMPVIGTVHTFSRFCSWLPQHTGLVKDLTILPAVGEDCEVMAHMLQITLQASTARVPGAAAPPPLRLRLFLSDGIPISPVLLSALACTQPQHVAIRVPELTAAACAALGTLWSLRELGIHCTALDTQQQSAQRFQDLCAAIGQLTQLTYLLLGPVHPASLQLLPASLRELCLGNQAAAAAAARAPVDLTHLTALTSLLIPYLDGGLEEDGEMPVQLPSALTTLTVISRHVRLTRPHMPLHVKLEEVTCTNELLVLQDLRCQRQPWSLELHATRHSAFDAAAGAALSACTSLTALVLRDGGRDSLPWSRYVAALTGLRRLELNTYESEEQDLLQLTALSTLTHLSLSCDVNDAVAVALALNLTGLCHFELSCGVLKTAGVLPVAAKLSGLRHLHLMQRRVEDGSCTEFSKALTPAVLSQLLPLTQLSYLGLPLGAACPSEARQQFLDGMPGLSCLHVAP